MFVYGQWTVGLLILYGIVWRPTQAEKDDGARKRRFWERLLGAALCAGMGWALGAMLGLTERGLLVWTQAPGSELIIETVDVVVKAIRPWLPGALPLFLV